MPFIARTTPSLTVAVLIAGTAILNGQSNAHIPIEIPVDRPGFVTVVVEDKDGNRLKNLAFDHPVVAGTNILSWDGSTVAGTAKPGDYYVRGLFHEGIVPRLEYS